MTRTAFKLIRLGALIGGGAAEGMQYTRTEDKIIGGLLSYGGYDWSGKKFNLATLGRAWMPYVAACLVTYGIPKLTSIIRRLQVISIDAFKGSIQGNVTVGAKAETWP